MDLEPGWCVKTNYVVYRTGPGHRFAVLGQIHQGHGVRIRQPEVHDPSDGTYWDNVDVLGGRPDVWILSEHVSWCE